MTSSRRQLTINYCRIEIQRCSRKALNRIGAKLFSIPPCSSELNPVENEFHLVKRRLTREGKEKKRTYESVDQYSERIKNTFMTLDSAVIDKIISTICQTY